MTDLIGRTLGSYRIVAQIGLGGMATVYKAYHPTMDRYVAIKVPQESFAREANFRARFLRETRTLARLEHPHILPVYDFGEEDGVPYLVLRLVEGGSLRDLIATGSLSVDRAIFLVDQVGNALAYAHQRGVTHRDVKPGNVLVDENGGALLTDFGIAKLLEETMHLTGTGVSVGTPYYMAPEQVQGKAVDARTDIYSLGVVLYEAVTGRRPFIADTPLAVALMHINDPLALPRTVNPAIPERVERVILRAMAKSPDDRFQSAAAFVTALNESAPASTPPRVADVTDPITVPTPPSPPSDSATPARRARPPPAALAAISTVVVVLALVGALFFRASAGTAETGSSRAPSDTPIPPTVASRPTTVVSALAVPASTSTQLPAVSSAESRFNAIPSPTMPAMAALLPDSPTSVPPTSTPVLATETVVESQNLVPSTSSPPPTVTVVLTVPALPSTSTPGSSTANDNASALSAAPSPTRVPSSATPVPPSPSPIPPTATANPPTSTPASSAAVPVLGGSSTTNGSMVLSWSYSGQLGANDYFDVRVWQDGQPANGIANVQQTSYAIGNNFPGGTYNWTIAVIRKQNGVIQTLAQAGQTLRFNWAPAGGSGGVQFPTHYSEGLVK